MDDHVTKSVITTMNSSTITELPDDTHINITVTAIGVKHVVFSVDSTSVSIAAFESMYMHTYVHVYKLIVFIRLCTYVYIYIQLS